MAVGVQAGPSTRGGHVQLFTTGSGDVRWRLLSGNNREIGRGTQAFADAELCRIAVKGLQLHAEHFDAGVRRVAGTKWEWQLADDGEVVAVSAHTFDRLIRCERGLEQFLARIPVAEISATLMLSHARRWRNSVAGGAA